MRLSQHKRTLIVSRLSRRAFEEREKALSERSKEIFNEAYDRLYSVKDREMMLTLPDGWLPESADMRIQFGDSYTHIYSTKRRRFKDEDHNTCVLNLDARDPLSEKYQQLKHDKKSLEAEKMQVKYEARAALNKFNTTAQLRKAWPEIIPLIEDVIAETPKPQLPAIPLEKLNRQFNLPPKGNEK